MPDNHSDTLVHLSSHIREASFFQLMAMNTEMNETAECLAVNETSIHTLFSQGLEIIVEEKAERFYEPEVVDDYKYFFNDIYLNLIYTV